MNTLLQNMYGKIAPDMCRLSVNGGIAVKTNNGYKTYNVKKGQLTNCNNFVFSIGEEFFFCIPTKKVKPGDIILVANKPRCVIKTESNQITVINYEDSVVETIIPERHMFLGNTYMFRKIVSMFGNSFGKGTKGTGKIMKYMMLSEMVKGNDTGEKNNYSALLPLILMDGKDTFGELFDFDEDAEEGDDL